MKQLRDLHQLLTGFLAQADTLAKMFDEAKLLLQEPIGQAIQSPKDKIPLSEAEIKILSLMAQDKTKAEIAAKLKLSPRTIEVHRYNIRKKLKLSSTTDLKTVAKGFGLS